MQNTSWDVLKSWGLQTLRRVKFDLDSLSKVLDSNIVNRKNMVGREDLLKVVSQVFR